MSAITESLIGLVILVIVALESLILSRKKTIPVIICDQIFAGIVVCLAFGKITLIYTLLLIIGLMFVKYRNHTSENADYDFTGRIFSISAIINRLRRPKELVIGRILPTNRNEIKYNMRMLELDNTVLSGESLVTGSSGSGKTTTLKTILKQRIDEGKPVVFFDYKGEDDILDDLQEITEAAGLPFYEFSARKCTFTYDPFINLDETGKVEALMNTRRWSTDGADEHYKTSMQLAIQNLIRSYDAARKSNGETVNYIKGLYEYSKTYHPQSNERDGFNNLQKSLEILLSSKASQLFGDDPDFTFERDEPYVICFSFTSANKALANQLSSFVYTDIMDRGTRNHYKDKLLLCIDEFGTLESSTIIKDLLEKGRSGGVQTVFSILDINQIAMNAGDHFVQAILGTINNYIIHAGATQSTADMLAGVQKYDKGYDIMSLRKPYKGKKPTALFISKYPIITKKNNQEVYRIIPYNDVLEKKVKQIEQKSVESEEVEVNFDIDQPAISLTKEPVIEEPITLPTDTLPAEDEIDLTQPINNIEDYL